MKKIAVILASLLMAACAGTPKNAPVQSDQSAPAPASVAPAAQGDVESQRLAAEKAELATLQKLSVYFDFDQFSIKSEFNAAIQRQADFIKSHGADVVTLEGNADERGSTEYNLALGEKRASAVKKSLNMLGVADKQLKVVSLSDEKPRLLCHEEKCWKENRRVDFVHKQ